MARDLLFFLSGNNFNFVGSQPDNVESVGNRGTNVLTVLTDATGEYKKVDTAEQRNVGTDYLADGRGKGIQGQNGAGIVRASTLFESLYIALATGKSIETALVIDQIFNGVGAEFFRAQKVEKDTGIKIAGTRAHGDSASGSKAHGGVDGDALAKGAEAGTIAEVREDGTLGELIAEVMHERLVRKAMETVAADTCFEVALREWEMGGHFGHGLVKNIVKTGELRSFWKDGLSGSDEGKRLRDMHGREMCCGTKLVQKLRGDGLVHDEMGTAMNDTVTYRHGRSV